MPTYLPGVNRPSSGAGGGVMMHSEAWQDGFKAGQIDLRLGYLSTYALAGAVLDPEGSYGREFGEGYKVGRQWPSTLGERRV